MRRSPKPVAAQHYRQGRLFYVLKKNGVIKLLSEGRGRRSAVLIFPALLNIAEGYGAF